MTNLLAENEKVKCGAKVTCFSDEKVTTVHTEPIYSEKDLLRYKLN